MKFKTEVGLGILAALGVLVLWVNTPWGIGVGYDSVFYLSAAQNFLHGLGFSRFDAYGSLIPLTHFPPLYPFMVAVASWLTRADIVMAARILACLWFGGVIFLGGWLVFYYTRSGLAGFLASAFILTSPVIVDLHLMAMSEPLFILLFMLSLFTLERYFALKKIFIIVLAAVFGSLAILDRYVGLSVIGVAGLALLVFNQRRFSRRLVDAGFYGMIGLLPALLWMLRNWLLVGSATNRSFFYHPLTREQVRAGLQGFSMWLLPVRFPALIRGAAMLLLAVFIATGLVLWARQLLQRNAGAVQTLPGFRFAGLLLGFACLYLAALAASLTFFDASTRLNDRILSPIYTSLIIGGMIVIWRGYSLERRRYSRLAVAGLGVALLALNVTVTRPALADMRQNGMKFTGREWQSSETVAAVKDLPSGTLLYSNEILPLYFLTGRAAKPVPEKVNVTTRQRASDYDDQLEAMRQEILKAGGALVIFDSIENPDYYPSVEKLSAGLILWKDTQDGAIFLPAK